MYGIEQALVDITYFDAKSPARSYSVLDRWDYGALACALGGGDLRTVGELLATLDEFAHARPMLVRVKLESKDLPWQVRALAAPRANATERKALRTEHVVIRVSLPEASNTYEIVVPSKRGKQVKIVTGT